MTWRYRLKKELLRKRDDPSSLIELKSRSLFDLSPDQLRAFFMGDYKASK